MFRSDSCIKLVNTIPALLLVGCCLFLALVVWYPGYRWPAPPVYPQVTPSISEANVGTWGYSRRQVYAVDLVLDDIQQYYEGKMQWYCIDNWQFEQLTSDRWNSPSNSWGLRELPHYVENSICRQTRCRVRRLGLAQEFSVLLCAENEGQTIVVHVDLWEN
jgi:hypothetical protein